MTGNAEIIDKSAVVEVAAPGEPSVAPLPLLDEQGIKVTLERLLVYGQSYPVREMRTVRPIYAKQDRALPASLSLLGLVIFIVGMVQGWAAAIVPGIMLAVVGWLTWRVQDPRHRLLLGMKSGETEVFSNLDAAFVARVAAALNQAIAAREQTTP